MPWERFRYRRNKVWVEVDDQGEAVLDDRGLAALRYKPDDDRTYTIRPAEIHPLDDPDAPPAETPSTDPIDVWAEAWVGQESEPAGIGIVLSWCGRVREIQRTLEPTPLPRAGVVAVLEALQAIRRPKLPVRVHTPHLETVRALRTGSRGGARSPLAEELRRALRRFPELTFAPPSPDVPHEAARRAVELARLAATTPR